MQPNGFGADLDAAEQWIDTWQASISERAAAAAALAQRLTALTAAARSRDGLVAVTVASSGELLELRLDERIRDQPARRTAELILATIADARRTVAELSRDAVAASPLSEADLGPDLGPDLGLGPNQGARLRG